MKLPRVALSAVGLLVAIGCSSGGGKTPATTIEPDISTAEADASVAEIPTGEAEEVSVGVSEPPADTVSPTVETSTEPVEDANGPPLAAAAEPAGPQEAEPVESVSRYDPSDQTLVVISAAEPDAGSEGSLWRAAQKERLRRDETGEAEIVLTDKNLAEMAAAGEITVADPTETPAVDEEGSAAETGAAEAGEPGHDEAYWRRGALELRLDWREAADSIERLEEEAFELRQKFYAEDDPFYRDGQIKPAWDRTLEQLAEARRQVVLKQQELERFLEQGRREGALPGWLREGVDLEPEIEIVEEGTIHQPGEPRVAPEAGGSDG